LVALLLGLPALRIRGLYLAVTTLAFAVATSTFLLRQQWLLPSGDVNRPVLFGRIGLDGELAYSRFCIAVLALCIVAVRSLRGSRTGRAIVGVRDNERAAQAYGIHATAAKLWAFAISGFIAGIAGGLLVHLQHGVPTGALGEYTPEQSLSVFLLAVIGGLGSVPGAVLGAVYVKGAQYLLPGPAAFLASGLGVLVLLLVLPGGLGSLLYGARDAVLRRLARRRGIVVASLVADLRVERDDDVAVPEARVPVGAPT
jgi:branched-chain amino acid transport system permease protein